MNKLFKKLITAIRLLLFFVVLTGFIYPMMVMGVTQFICPWRANGSFIHHRDETIGSLLIGQSFTQNNYFWSRPSATELFPYNADHSNGSNIAPSNPQLITTIQSRIQHLKQFNPSAQQPIPVDLVTSSGSGLDPDISIPAAEYQVPRIALARHISQHDLLMLIQLLERHRTFGILGEPRVNVLQLNLALDSLPVKEKE